MADIVRVSALAKTWIMDIDGTIVKHNGYKTDGHDTLLDGAGDFFKNISPDDTVILITSRTEEYKEMTERFLRENGIRFDHVIYNLPYGERILVNDKKTSGMITSVAVNTERDRFMQTVFEVDETI